MQLLSHTCDLCRKFPRCLIRLKPCHIDCQHHQAFPDWVQPLWFYGQPDKISLDLETKARVIKPDKIASLLSVSLCNIVCRLFTGQCINTHIFQPCSPFPYFTVLPGFIFRPFPKQFPLPTSPDVLGTNHLPYRLIMGRHPEPVL